MTPAKVRKAILPVAGWGTRFLPATKTMPKEMLCVVDKPVIQYAVEEALAAGIEEIIFVTGRGKEVIENHFDRNFELEDLLEKQGKMNKLKSIKHVVLEEGKMFYTRQSRRLGLGHAVLCARPFIGDEPFAVILPDDIMVSHAGESVLKEMVDVYEANNTPVVLSLKVSDEDTKRYGVLDTAGSDLSSDGTVSVQGFVEKPKTNPPSNLAIMGRYILTPRVFDFLAEKQVGAGGEIQLTDAMHKLAGEQGFTGYRLNGLRLDCGDKPGYIMAQIYMAMQDEELRGSVTQFIKSLDLAELK
jgi:UTP--glucose-1-phosphate uridylyltransferase